MLPTCATLPRSVPISPVSTMAPVPDVTPTPSTATILSIDEAADDSKTSELQRTAARRQMVMQMALLTLGGMMYQVGLGMCMPLYSRYSEQLGLGESAGGLVISAPCIARVLLNLIIGPLVDVWGRKPLLIGGSLICALGGLRTASATSLGTMLLGRMLVGVGGAAKDIAAQALRLDVVERFPAHRGILMGWAQALTTLAYAAGPVVGGRLAARQSDVREPFYVFAYLVGMCAPLYAMLPDAEVRRRRRPSFEGSNDDGKGGHDDGKGGKNGKGGLPPSAGEKASQSPCGSTAMRELLRDPRQRSLLVLRFGLSAGWAAWMTILPLHLWRRFGLASDGVGVCLSLLTLLGFASSPVGGLLADRIGRNAVAHAGAAASACALGLLPFASSMSAFCAVLAVWEVGTASLGAASSAAAADITRVEMRGTQTSLLGQVQDATFVVLPTALGVLSGSLGTDAALALTAMVQLCAVVSSARLIQLSRATTA